MDSNSKVIEDLYAAFARGDIPFILERLSADAQFDNSDSPEMPHGGNLSGKRRHRKVLRQYRRRAST